MTRCQVSEAIAKHCNQPEEAECPLCSGSMTNHVYGLACNDDTCDGVIYAPDEDDF